MTSKPVGNESYIKWILLTLLCYLFTISTTVKII